MGTGEVKEKIKFWENDYPAFKAIGAQEIYCYLKGELTLEEATKKAVIRTRQYAKRQFTWARGHMKSWEMIYSANTDDLYKKAINKIS